jgi:beta-ribofuranosylaminobenzene 5'-phosphate synthase
LKDPSVIELGSERLSRGPASVTTTVPARLHLGFLDLNGEIGRKFGSIGVAISGLRTRVTVSRGAVTHVGGPEAERAARYVARLHDYLGLDAAHHVHIDEAIPSHAGLGSGTQLALAIAAGIRRLHNLPLDVRGDAFRLGRGRRSGVGIGLFDTGGVVVDGGRGEANAPAPIISRIPFPDAWRIVLVLDPGRTGVHGDDETAAFARLPSFRSADAAHICRLVLMQALPALVEADIAAFGGAIKEMQQLLGAHFAPAQDGEPFTSPNVAAALALMEGAGAHGIGQSSWGPTGFAFVRAQDEAERLIALARKDARCRGLDIRACRGLNHGADIAIDAAALPEP